MSSSDYMKTLGESIFNLRKEMGLTQESLAEKLNISFQAVSKWENGQTSPDIIMLPLLADLFKVSIDALFGRNSGGGFNASDLASWKDDDVIRGVIFKGRKILSSNGDLSMFTFKVEGDVLNVEAGCNINCGNVEGNASAAGSINCGNVGGNADAGGAVTCGNVEGDASAGGGVICGNVGGDADAGGGITCNIISGDASAGGNIECKSIGGDATSG